LHEIDAMPASEFFEFYLAEQLMPFGEKREDIRIGILAALVANMFAGHRSETFSPEDFMIPEPQQPKPQSTEEILEIMLRLQKAQNAYLQQTQQKPN
jgi:hypothetical protein